MRKHTLPKESLASLLSEVPLQYKAFSNTQNKNNQTHEKTGRHCSKKQIFRTNPKETEIVNYLRIYTNPPKEIQCATREHS